MFTQLLAAIAAVYGVLAALITLLQTRQMLARRSSCDVSARFLASYAGGYGIWLAYGLSTGPRRGRWHVTTRDVRCVSTTGPRASRRSRLR